MKTTPFLEYVWKDLLQNKPEISVRFMMGGWTLYYQDLPFGIVVNDKLYFKVGENNLDEYEKMGCKPFTYSRNGQEYAMSYWEVPGFLLEGSEREEIWKWVDASLQVPRKTVKKKAKNN